MYDLVSIILIGISLSMDTFSLSLSMASLSKNSKYLKIFPFIVGLFHFCMPLLGEKIGFTITQIFNVASNIILGLVLIILGINLAISYFKNEEVNIELNFIKIILLAFSVSIDSFTVGLGLSDLTNYFYLASFIFSILSFSFTLLGLIIGKYSGNILGRYATLLGIFLLLILGVFHIFV